MAALALLIGCSGGPAAEGSAEPGCGDGDGLSCALDAEAAALEPALADPALRPAALARAQALPPERQHAVLRRLLARHPDGEGAFLCAALPAGADRRLCDEMHRRPHLWTPLHPDRRLRPAAPPPPVPAPGPCAAAADPPSCLLAGALERRGAAEVQAWCAQPAAPDGALAADRLRAECLFLGADAQLGRGAAGPPAAGPPSPDAAAAAAQLCAASGVFQSQCLAHLIEALGARAPAGAGAADWAPLNDAVQAARGALGAPVGDAVASAVWARAVQDPARAALLLPVLPPTAAPPLRSLGARGPAGALPERQPPAGLWCASLGGVRARDAHADPELDAILAELASGADPGPLRGHPDVSVRAVADERARRPSAPGCVVARG